MKVGRLWTGIRLDFLSASRRDHPRNLAENRHVHDLHGGCNALEPTGRRQGWMYPGGAIWCGRNPANLQKEPPPFPLAPCCIRSLLQGTTTPPAL